MSSTTSASPGHGLLERLSPRIVALCVTLIAFVLYLVTMNRTFGFIDKGELAAVVSTLGIAHPTGYPTITLLGYLFTLILPVREVLALNILAALLTAGGAGMMTLLLFELTGRFRRTPDHGAEEKQARGTKKGAKGTPMPGVATMPDGIRALYAGTGALFTALTATWWGQANGFEVYCLHALMMPLVTLMFLRYVEEEATVEAGARVSRTGGFTRRGMLFSIALGLSFTNHMTTILLAPAFLVYYFWRLGFGAASFRRLLFLAPGFIVGLLPYLWLPIRASMKPRFNWGNPDNLKRFIDHVSGKQYRIWMFTNPDTFGEQSAFFFGKLPAELGYIGIAVVLLGIVYLALKNVRLSVFVFLLFVACLVYAGDYDILDIESYYLTAIFAIGIWSAFGLYGLHERAGRNVTVAVAVLLVAMTAAFNYHEDDESGNRLVEDMTVNMLQTLPPNALVFSSQWDFWVSGSFYMQAVEKMRSDVLVIDPELLRRSWYLDELTVNYPEFMAPVKNEVDAFRRELYKFEDDIPYDPATIQSAYVGMINAMIDRSIGHRLVFVTGDVPAEMGARYRRVPNHLAMQLVPGNSYLVETFPAYRFKFWQGHVDGYTARNAELYARSLYARALYEAEFKRNDLAMRYLQYALTFDPGYSPSEIPSLPLNSEDQVIGTINFFGQLRAMRR